MKHEDTTLWYWQVVTGFALFFLASVHLYIMLTRPDRIGPFESADRVWSDLMWPLYLVLLFAVEFHGGVGLYRLALKWGWFEGDGSDAAGTRRKLRFFKWALTGFFLVLGLLTLAAYMKIGIDHAPFYGQPYVPAAARHGGDAMKVVYTDVLVIGGGLAGLRVAIGARRRGHDAIVLSLVPPKRSHSAAAQGGMQASLANVTKGQGDNEDVHFEDTVKGSDWGADQQVVRMFVNTAPKAVRELAAWGVPWSRVRQGDRQVIINGEKVTITERDAAHGLVAQRDFGGTRKWRTCYVSDGTGHAMLFAVGDRAIAEGIPVHERTEALALIHDGQRCYGAIVRDLITGEITAYVAKATAIATGGAGRVYRVTTNAVICEGIGAALALETGIVPLGNMEAVQFHPTGIFPAGILVTEGCRGDGGLLRDASGHRFMPDYEPEKKELASRDVVSRRMEEHIRKGNAAKSRFGEHLLARHHAARAQAHRAQPARSQGDLPVLPRRRPGGPVDSRASRPALHDGRRAHRPHRPDARAARAVCGRRSRLLGHARVQSPRRQFSGRDGRRRHDRRRVHRGFRRKSRGRDRHSDGRAA